MEQENLYDSLCTTLILVILIPCGEEMCLIWLIVHLSTKHITVAINLATLTWGGEGGSRSVAFSNCLVVNILQNISNVLQ